MHDPTKLLLGALGVGGLVIAGLALYTWRRVRQIERESPPQGKFVDVDGHRLHYVERGGGPALVLIHGLAGQLLNFSYLLDRLAERHRVILVDRPGSGHSVGVRGHSHGVRAQAAVLAGFLKKLGLDRPQVVGHSLGGALALALALDHPETVGGLALIAPLTQPETRVPAPFRGLALRGRGLRALLAWTLVVPLARFGRQAGLDALFRPDLCPADFEVAGGTALLLRPANFLSASADLRAANEDLPGLAARYGQLELPVGVLFGRGDQILDPVLHGETLAAANPRVHLTLMDGGHMIPVTAPEQVVQWITAHTEQTPSV